MDNNSTVAEIVEHIAPPPTPLPATDRHVRPGGQTSEFYMALAGAGIGMAWIVASTFNGHPVPMTDVVLLIGTVQGIYTGSRTLIKRDAISQGN